MASDRACRDCGAPITGARAARSGRCRGCYPRHCTSCDAWLPAGRACRYCTDCLRDRQAVLRSRPGRICYQCAGSIPDGWKSTLCPRCNKQASRLWSAVNAARSDRPCRDCGEPVGDHRTIQRCRQCNKSYRAALFARPGRRCAICGQNIGRRPASYCADCQRTYHNWRSAYQRGEHAARMVRPIRRYHKPQERNP